MQCLHSAIRETENIVELTRSIGLTGDGVSKEKQHRRIIHVSVEQGAGSARVYSKPAIYFQGS